MWKSFQQGGAGFSKSTLNPVFHTLLLMLIQFSSETFSLRRSPPPSATDFPHLRKPPEVWFSEYRYFYRSKPTRAEEEFRTEFYFDNDVVRKNGSDYLLYDQDILSYVFTCEASYPIKWTLFTNPELGLVSTNKMAEVQIHSFRKSHFSPKMKQPTNDGYNLKLKFVPLSPNFTSLLFTCESTKAEGSASTSTHIFLLNIGTTNIYQEGETVTSSSPDSDNVPVPQQPQFHSQSDTSGHAYIKCGKNSATTSEYQPLDFGTGVIESCSSHIECCTGVENLVPKYFVGYCGNPQECEIMKQFFAGRVQENIREYFQSIVKVEVNYTSGCVSVPFYPASTLVACKADDHLNYLEQFVHTFGGSGTGNGDKIKINQKMFLAALTWDKDLTRNENFSVIYKFDFKLREDSANFNSVSDYYEEDDEHEDKFIMDLEELDPNRIYEDTPLMFMCIGASYFYTNGGYLRITWKDGKKSVFTLYKKYYKFVTLRQRDLGQVNFYRSLGPIFSGPVLAHLHMESVECFMPLWDSDGWESLSMNISVLPSFIPKFKEVSNETFYLALNESNREIVLCTLIEGLPKPRLKFTKSDKPILKFGNNSFIKIYEEFDEEINKNVTVVKLVFTTVTHEVQDIYKCEAHNVAGTKTQFVRVVVTERGGSFIPFVVIVIISVLSCVVILIIVAVRNKKLNGSNYLIWLWLTRR